jgi:hypothetical protein
VVLTILRPRAQRVPDHTGQLQYRLSDYIGMSHVDLRGTWEFREHFTAEELAELARFTNMLEEAS